MFCRAHERQIKWALHRNIHSKMRFMDINSQRQTIKIHDGTSDGALDP